MSIWLIVGGWFVVCIGTTIFLNILDPPSGPLVNEMTEGEARNTIKGVFWPVLLLIGIVKLLLALAKYIWVRRASKNAPKST